jgi:hypothetical protein
MAFSTTFRQALALLLFNATAIANVADNAASSPITNIHASLHTADPSSGNQTTSEIAYTSYARVAVARTAGGWSSTAGVVTNVAAVTFPACTGGTGTASHVGVGTASSGTGVLWVGGAVTSSLAVSSGITPQFSISGLSITVA